MEGLIRAPVREAAFYREAVARGLNEDDPVITFTHVFVDPDKRGDRTLEDADEILAKLQSLGPPSVWSLLPLGAAFFFVVAMIRGRRRELSLALVRVMLACVFVLAPVGARPAVALPFSLGSDG